MKRNQFLKLWSQKLSGTLAGADVERLNKAMAANVEYQKLAALMQPGPEAAGDPGRLEKIWAQIAIAEQTGIQQHNNFARVRPPFTRSLIFKIAAMLVLISVSAISYHLFNRSENGFETFVTTNQKSLEILPDGTKIWLNKNSTLRFNKDFGAHLREITFSGEGYFDVAKNPKIPLYIQAGDIKIEVKGTAFNVSAYKEDPEIKIALVHGAIQITGRLNHPAPLLLKPNEEFIFRKYGNDRFQIISLAPAQLQQTTRWTIDTLTFAKEKLKDLAGKLEKKYAVKIDIRSEQLKEVRFSGTFTTETITQALDALKVSFPLTYTINKGLVVINDQP